MTDEAKDQLAAKIPADVEVPDKILAGLTFRQLAIMCGTGLLVAWVYLVAGDRLPVPILAAVILPVVALGSALALGRRDGISLDRLAGFALIHLRRDRKLIAAAEPVPAPPGWCRVRGRLPAPLRLPVRAIREDGVLELADGGLAAIVRAGTVAFGLRTSEEQAALVSVFAGWLNSLDSPVQILLQARPVDLFDLADHITDNASALADPALEQAARDHADFLTELSDTRDLLTRDVLLVFRHDTAQPPGAHRHGGHSQHGRRRERRDSAAAIVTRRAEESLRSMATLGVTADVLDAAEIRGLLVRSLSPRRAEPIVERPLPDEVITSRKDASPR